MRICALIPAFNESPYIANVVERALQHVAEVVVIDDGSVDGTAEIARAAGATCLQLPQNRGKASALRGGIAYARERNFAYVITLDGDGQNNPAFLPDLIAAIENGSSRVGLAAGQRVGRKDTGFKKLQSRIANGVRNAILRDGTRDTGCGLKAFPREVFLAMPYFDGLHRFLPALVRREGYEIAYVDVIDRPRHSGVSNYGFFDRLWIGIMDLAGVWWLIRRKKPTPVATEVQ